MAWPLIPAFVCLLVAACAPTPQDTRVDQTPDWVSRNAGAAPVITPPTAPAVPATDAAWFVRCTENAVTTAAECFAQRWAGGGRFARVSFGRARNGASFGPHLHVTHDWPDPQVQPIVRVDTWRPLDLDQRRMGRSCEAIRQMKIGAVMRVQAADWPRCEACMQYEVSLPGFAAAYEEARRRAAAQGINASCPGDPPLR
ncbi:hypothetical protein [Falsiroseomonas sp.]|uniref:hypothetical protein n=1 Tax=Falsiroseomonas sp. TaxID=2870721 RepID=UPI003F6FD616